MVTRIDNPADRFSSRGRRVHSFRVVGAYALLYGRNGSRDYLGRVDVGTADIQRLLKIAQDKARTAWSKERV